MLKNNGVNALLQPAIYTFIEPLKKYAVFLKLLRDIPINILAEYKCVFCNIFRVEIKREKKTKPFSKSLENDKHKRGLKNGKRKDRKYLNTQSSIKPYKEVTLNGSTAALTHRS